MSSGNCCGFASLWRSQMLELIGRSRIDRDAIRRQRASPESIHWLSTLSRRTLVAESDFGFTHGIAGDATFDYQFVVNPAYNYAFTPVSAFEPPCPNRNGLMWCAIPGRGLRLFRLSRAKHFWLVFVWFDLGLFALLSHVIVRMLSKVPLISLLKGRPVRPAP